MTDYYKTQGTEKFGELYERYAKAIVALGYDEDEVNICFADDISLAISNTYQAVQHAKNGGKGYSYTFCIPYDSKFDDFELGAAHAIDCFFLFGNFDGTTQKGTKEQVDASIKFQNMIAAFCKTGDPSLPDLAWPEYNNDTREKMMFYLDEFKVVENPEKERVNILLEMLDEVDSRYSPGLSSIIAMLAETHPEIVELVH